MGYYIDLKKISINNYKKILKTADLLPSWKVLEKDIDKNLNSIKKQNIGEHDMKLCVESAQGLNFEIEY